MRKSGTINNIDYLGGGFCIRNLAYQYKLINDYSDKKIVYVLNFKELRKEIDKFNRQ